MKKRTLKRVFLATLTTMTLFATSGAALAAEQTYTTKDLNEQLVMATLWYQRSAEVRALQQYLRACVAAAGDPTAVPDGAWTDWADRRFHASNVERAAMLAAGDPSPPPSVLTLMGMR